MRPALDTLAAYAKDPAPFTCLVLVADQGREELEAVPRRGGQRVRPTSTRLRSAPSTPARSVKLLRARGKRIACPPPTALVELVGRDLRRLDSEADKLDRIRRATRTR